MAPRMSNSSLTDTAPSSRTRSETARVILAERYLRRDDHGKIIETVDEMFVRVGRAIAQPARRYGEDVEFWQERFVERMRRCEFLPNSPTLMNAGLPNGQLAACFVLPVEDDLDSIFTALGQMARIHQTGGGTGFSFSRLRPRDDRVRSTGGTTSGPLSFMELFDQTTEVIRRGGRRRGANMAVLRVDHPDIEAFIDAKKDPRRLQNFNLSVGITDEFWSALTQDKAFALRNPRSGAIIGHVKARQLFNKITEAAWICGDPGLLFLDEINRANPTPALGAIEATNPCGEQPLLPYESCTLGSLNLAAFAADDDLDWQKFAAAIYDAVVFLDNVIDANHYSFPAIQSATRQTRKIGLGVMGLADLFAQLGMAYDSEAAVALADKIARFLSSEARAASIELGERRDSFPAFSQSVWRRRGVSSLRNATVTCIAPTGTISLIAGVSPSIEPFFALALSRLVIDHPARTEMNPLLQSELAKLGTSDVSDLDIIKHHGSIRGLSLLPEALRRRFPIALEISPQYHLRMQAAFQTHVDAAVSKTVNLPNQAPQSTVEEIFTLARELRLKGVTVYRYGSRAGQTLSLVEDQLQPDCRECAV